MKLSSKQVKKLKVGDILTYREDAVFKIMGFETVKRGELTIDMVIGMFQIDEQFSSNAITSVNLQFCH